METKLGTCYYYYSPLKQFPKFESTSSTTKFSDRLPISRTTEIKLTVVSRKVFFDVFKNCNCCRFVLMFMHFCSFALKFFRVLWKCEKGKSEELNFCRAHHNCRLNLKSKWASLCSDLNLLARFYFNRNLTKHANAEDTIDNKYSADIYNREFLFMLHNFCRLLRRITFI